MFAIRDGLFFIDDLIYLDAKINKTNTNLMTHEFRVRQAVIPLQNQYRVSMAWGTGTHSSNAWAMRGRLGEDLFDEEPTLVEVAVLMPDGNILHLPWEEDGVISYATSEQVLTTIERVSDIETPREYELDEWGREIPIDYEEPTRDELDRYIENNTY